MDDAVDDLAHNALQHARGVARSSPRRRKVAAPQRRSGGGYSAPGADPTHDPQPVGSVFAGYAEDRGWDRPLAQARVFADWNTLVGSDVAAHCHPQTLREGELRIAAESTAWATQLRLLSSTLLARLVEQLGPDVVTRLMISGPTAPSWKHGGRSVRGSRGPRDTYG